jgi:hypothetical protein
MHFVHVTVAILGIQLIACQPDELAVNGQVGLDDDCEVRADEAHAVELPVFDIAAGGVAGSDACEDPFVAQLWVENASGVRVRMLEAVVRLMTAKGETLSFRRSEIPGPNPFLVTVTPVPGDGSAVIEVEVIPAGYATALSDFSNEKILAKIALRGETADGDAIESAGFMIPIEICDGCRTLCASDDAAQDAACSAPELGPLRTFCVDPEC